MTDQTLLPVNSSALERGLDLAFGTLIEAIIPPFPELMNPAAAPAEFLPYLAADRGVDEWRSTAPVSEQRATVAAAWQTKRLAGTRAALEHAVSGLEMTPEVVAWYEQIPHGDPYSFSVLAWISRPYDADIDDRLMRRLQAAKSERDTLTLRLGARIRGAVHMGAVTRAGDRVRIRPAPVTHASAPPLATRVAVGRIDRGKTTIYPRPPDGN